MIIKSALFTLLASAMGLALVGCMTAEPAAENVEETAEALTTGITFDPTNFEVTYTVDGTNWVANTKYYPPGNSSVTFNVPCDATQVGVQTLIKYDDTGMQLWPSVKAEVPGLTAVTSNLNPLTQGNSELFGQISNRPANPLSGAASDQPLAVVLTLTTYVDSGYSTRSSVDPTTITYYIRRLCTCP